MDTSNTRLEMPLTSQGGWHDPRQQRQEFINRLDDFAHWVFTESVRDAVGKPLIEQVRAAENAVRNRLCSDFNLVVLGDFKRGKSTLINTLLQRDLVATDIAPATITINHIRYGPELKAEAHLAGGGRIRLAVDDLAADQLLPALTSARDVDGDRRQTGGMTAQELVDFLRAHFDLDELEDLCFQLNLDHEAVKGNTPKQKARELIRYTQRHGQYEKLLETALELRPAIRKREARETRPGPRETRETQPGPRRPGLVDQLPANVSHLVIEAPIPWLERITLIDTPGMNDLYYRFDRQVQEFLPHADAIIYVISALSPLSASERAFLRISLLQQDFAKIFFVVNMMDRIHPREAPRLVRSITAKINQLFQDAQVFGVSALDEWQRLNGEAEGSPQSVELAAEFDRFRTALDESVVLNRDILQLDRAVAMAEQMVESFETSVLRIRRATETDQARLDELIRQHGNQDSDLNQQLTQRGKEIRATIESLGEQTCRWMGAFLDRLAREAVPSLADVRADDVQRHFHFFLSDVLNDAVQRCLELHRPQMVALVDQASTSIRGDVDRLTTAFLHDTRPLGGGAPPSFGKIRWNNLDALHAMRDKGVVSMLGFNSNLLSIAGALLQKAAANRQIVAYQQRLRATLPELRTAIVTEIRDLYGDIADDIEQQIAAAYRQDIEASLASMQQAKEHNVADMEQRERVSKVLQEVSDCCAETRSALQDFKKQLWPDVLGDAGSEA